jgi:hypothetical protein
VPMNKVYGRETFRIKVTDKYVSIQCVIGGCRNVTTFKYTRGEDGPTNIKFVRIVVNFHELSRH